MTGGALPKTTFVGDKGANGLLERLRLSGELGQLSASRPLHAYLATLTCQNYGCHGLLTFDLDASPTLEALQ